MIGLGSKKTYLRLGTLAWVLATCACSPDGKIKEDSKTRVCASEINDSLAAFKSQLGMSFDHDTNDARIIFSTGKLEKSYTLATAEYVAYFGLEVTDEGCDLQLYKQAKSEPGEGTSTTHVKKSVVLDHCQCVEE